MPETQWGCDSLHGTLIQESFPDENQPVPTVATQHRLNLQHFVSLRFFQKHSCFQNIVSGFKSHAFVVLKQQGDLESAFLMTLSDDFRKTFLEA